MVSFTVLNDWMILVILTPYHNKSARLFALDSETLHTNISEKLVKSADEIDSTKFSIFLL